MKLETKTQTSSSTLMQHFVNKTYYSFQVSPPQAPTKNHQIVFDLLKRIFPSRLMTGTSSSSAVAAIIRSGISGTLSHETSLNALAMAWSTGNSTSIESPASIALINFSKVSEFILSRSMRYTISIRLIAKKPICSPRSAVSSKKRLALAERRLSSYKYQIKACVSATARIIKYLYAENHATLPFGIYQSVLQKPKHPYPSISHAGIYAGGIFCPSFSQVRVKPLKSLLSAHVAAVCVTFLKQYESLE